MTQSTDLNSAPDRIQPTEATGNGQMIPHEPEPHPRASRMIIAVALVVFAIMMALLLIRWITADPPTSLVLVQGNHNHEGLVVVLKTPAGLEIRKTALGRSTDYAARFHVPSAKYEMSILRDGKPLLRQQIVLHESMGLVYDLSTIPNLSTTQPATP